MWWWFVTAALANSWGPYDEGFVIDTRADAPLDARLLYAANFLVDAQVTSGPGAPFALEVLFVTGVGAPPRVALLPPVGGWEPASDYTVTVTGAGYDTDGDVLSFTTGVEVAADAPAFTVGDVTYGDWSEERTYAWGCCLPVRSVEVEVDVPTADPWGFVEIVGDFKGPSQITTADFNEHLDLVVGPGSHVLAFEQWREDGVPEPACFDVVTVGASGDRGTPETFCADAAGCGCASSPAPRGLPVVALPLLLLARRRRRGHSRG